MARPLLVLNKETVEKFASIGCPNEEIAILLGCSADTLERRFAGSIKSGRAKMKSSLRRGQFQRAMAGDNTMLIWLGKVILEQREIQEIRDERLTSLINHINRPKEEAHAKENHKPRK